MKSRLLDAVLYLFPVVSCMIPFLAEADTNAAGSLPAAADTSGGLSDFFSLESVLIVVFVLLVLAVIARKTKLP